MYQLLFYRFFKTKICQLGLALILILGSVSIITGKQFLVDQKNAAAQVAEQQQKHIERNLELHKDDLPLLLYYLKFAVVNQVDPLAGLSIGQQDLIPNIKRVKMLTLEGQKYDADLVNPAKLLFGNLDLSFLIVCIFPLLVIAFMYNLYSEEDEAGTWKMVNVMAKSKPRFLMAKLSVRLLVLGGALVILLLTAAVVLGIPFNNAFLIFSLAALLYLTFWFTLCFFIVCLKRNSNFNALSLLTLWLLLVVLMPAFVNNHITVRYPVPEALSTMIKQRDGYHTKWDTNKEGTMDAFYAEYPQFASYGYPPEEGFHWGWYYAMQHLGDVESRAESQSMKEKIYLREKSSRSWALAIPSMHTQLALNDIAKTGLSDYMEFLEFTTDFHEKTRLHFYPKVFSGQGPESVEWDELKPEVFQIKDKRSGLNVLIPLIISVLLLGVASFYYVRKI